MLVTRLMKSGRYCFWRFPLVGILSTSSVATFIASANSSLIHQDRQLIIEYCFQDFSIKISTHRRYNTFKNANMYNIVSYSLTSCVRAAINIHFSAKTSIRKWASRVSVQLEIFAGSNNFPSLSMEHFRHSLFSLQWLSINKLLQLEQWLGTLNSFN